MIIRKMQPESDVARLANFDTSFSSEYVYRAVISGMSVEIIKEKLDAPFQKTYLFDFIRNDIDEADFSIVAEIEGAIGGFATAKYEDWNKRISLTGIFVSPESKGKGIGRALINSVLEYAGTTKARCLWAETQNVNYPAIQFYTRIGFEFCGFDKSLYNPADVSPGETAFYFCLNINRENT